MSEPSPAEIHAHMRVLANGILERDATIKQLLAQLPPDGQGRWRQGTKNPRNLYVHQGDDEVGQPVGQLYSAELAALVCDAVNAIARVREIHPRLSAGSQDVCVICFDEDGEFAPWPCPTIGALGQSKETL